VGSLAYADDLVPLATSACALCKMLATCNAYAAEYCMSFNAQKSKCLKPFLSIMRCTLVANQLTLCLHQSINLRLLTAWQNAEPAMHNK